MHSIATKKMDSDLISQFLDITTARHFIELTNEDLNEAILLFFTNNETSQQLTSPPNNDEDDDEDQDEVGDPLLRRQDTLYDFEDSSIWTRRQHPIPESVYDNVESMFRPPHELLFMGTFEEAKVEAQRADRWLILNIQLMLGFNSDRLNRDVWSNKAVSETIRDNFIFWQEYDDTIERLKVMTSLLKIQYLQTK